MRGWGVREKGRMLTHRCMHDKKKKIMSLSPPQLTDIPLSFSTSPPPHTSRRGGTQRDEEKGRRDAKKRKRRDLQVGDAATTPHGSHATLHSLRLMHRLLDHRRECTVESAKRRACTRKRVVCEREGGENEKVCVCVCVCGAVR